MKHLGWLDLDNLTYFPHQILACTSTFEQKVSTYLVSGLEAAECVVPLLLSLAAVQRGRVVAHPVEVNESIYLATLASSRG